MGGSTRSTWPPANFRGDINCRPNRPSPRTRVRSPRRDLGRRVGHLVRLVPTREGQHLLALARRPRPDLVIFAGGYTLYALNAQTGHLFWKHDYTGRPQRPPDPNNDDTRIFSSPVVVSGKVLFGVDTDGEKASRGYVVGASLATGDPMWEYQDDVNSHGRIENNGCGNVWSSGTVLPRAGLVVFDSADCNFADPPPTSESVFALHIANGTLAWMFRPVRAENQCDLDFGGSANAGLSSDGAATFLGVGSKGRDVLLP